jgi:hypothetical protein
VIATACTIETIVEDPLLPILEEDSNITKSTGQIGRPCLDHNPTSPRFKLLMIDFIPNPKIGVFSNVRLYFRRALRPFLRKKFVQSFFSWGEVYLVYLLSASRVSSTAAGSIMKVGTTGAPPLIAITARPGMVGALPVFSFIRKGFVDQHDRDIIFDLVDEATRLADQSISCPV